MSRIDELIERLCPDGVRFARIDELFDIRGGYTPSRSNAQYWSDGTIPWFRMEDIREFGHVLTQASQKISESALKKSGLMPKGSIIVATSATIGEHAILGVSGLCNQRFTCLTKKPAFSERLNDKFLYYYCFLLDEFCKMNLTQGSFASVSMPAFKSFKFPVPPIEIQEEIVRILDSFSELETELETELEARKTQFTYYRDQLLLKESLEKVARRTIETIPLGDFANIYDGTHQTPKYTESGIKFVSVENIDDLHASNKCISEEAFKREYKHVPHKGDVFMTRIGTIGKCAVVDTDEQLAYYVSLCLIRPKHDIVLPEYLKHALESSTGRHELYRRTILTAVPVKINLEAIGKIQLPIPPIDVQQRIIEILDNFEKITFSFADGIPAEIEARRKQYEYYRDKLLTFKEKPSD